MGIFYIISMLSPVADQLHKSKFNQILEAELLAYRDLLNYISSHSGVL